MKTSKGLQNWDATLKIAVMLSVVCIGSVVINFILAWKLVFGMERLILVPPGLEGPATIERSGATKNYLEAWSLYFTTVLGSVTPSNAQSIADYLGKNVDQPIWHAVRGQILSVIDDPQYNRQGAFNMFVPIRTVYEPDTKKTFVEGTMSTLSYRTVNQSVAIAATYELVIEIKNGIPVVTALDSYPGVARTAKWRDVNPQILAKDKKEHDAATAQALLRRDDLMEAQSSAEKTANAAAAAKDAASTTTKETTQSSAPVAPPSAVTPTNTAAPKTSETSKAPLVTQ